MSVTLKRSMVQKRKFNHMKGNMFLRIKRLFDRLNWLHIKRDRAICNFYTGCSKIKILKYLYRVGYRLTLFRAAKHKSALNLTLSLTVFKITSLF